jgi:diaminopimelate decarboxylase
MSAWWLHDSFAVDHGTLALDGVALKELAHQHGTPLFVYSRATIQRQLQSLQAALAAATDRYAIFYAMKANRCAGVLEAVRSVPGVGVDTCSPREIALALQYGFPVEKISFNAGMLSCRDLTIIVEHGVHCTLDSFSSLQRYGSMAPRNTPVSLRFNPGVRVGYGQGANLRYGNDKFGFEAEELEEALHVAYRSGLVVDGVHMHLGWGLQESAADLIGAAFMRLAEIARQVPELRTINVGGGLGGRYQAVDEPLTLSTWSRLLRDHLAPLGATIACEPGTFVVGPAGVLLLEVNTVEHRRGVNWVGVNAGFALNPMPALYGIPVEIVPVGEPLSTPKQSYRVVGHINETTDVWAKECLLPEVRELDLLAFLPAGAYCTSMSSDHCMRGQAPELVI